MKICILTPRFPFPENGGDVLRINNIARYLKQKGHNLTLCSFIENHLTEKSYSEAKLLYDNIHVCKRNKIESFIFSFIFLILRKPIQCGYYYSLRYKKLFAKICKSNSFDLYIAHLNRMTTYLKTDQQRKITIVEMTDALSKTYSLSAISKTKSLKVLIYRIEKSLITKNEEYIFENYRKVILVSEEDIKYLGSPSNAYYYTNGIRCIENDYSYNSKKICFVGNMRSLQNQDAVLHFINNIYPFIKEKKSDIEFHIVGSHPSEQIKSYNGVNGIVVTGYVNSVEAYIKDSAIIVAPVYIAAGIQNKVLVGMACKIPVIMTSLISKAIPELINMKNCIIEDEDKLFAEKCILLLQDKTLRNQIASEGYNIVKENYDWNSKLEGYENI